VTGRTDEHCTTRVDAKHPRRFHLANKEARLSPTKRRVLVLRPIIEARGRSGSSLLTVGSWDAEALQTADRRNCDDNSIK